ncbi:LysR family transcriptional regulator [Aliamphritea spongicola]|uniref:LysR family transcriptional regulator n=1 Tax=Aliamphritea spongicola TaxID=707589 RepID=UPI00196B265C|nr:LysR family transcriptional regulator [Aliamphritea spongicola]MBN3561168.1 LysR family transcriptional regulator [Aliamphritea spongicola]
MDQLTAMRIFVRVIQLGSFSAAAREENSTQATASKKVAALEQKLGVKLINRSSREQSLTEAGSHYFEQCLSVLGEIDEMEASVRARTTSPKGLLRITAPVPFARLVLAPLLPEFLAQYPDIKIDMPLEERHLDLISEGIDVAIRARKLEDSSLIAKPLFDNPLILVASPTYLSDRGIPVSPADLKSHDCIVYSLNKFLNNWHFSKDGSDQTVAVSGTFRSNSGETNLALVLAGQGITQIPVWMVDEHLRKGELVQLLSEYETDHMPINIVYPQSRYLPLKVRCFIDFISDKLGDRYR